VVLAQTQTTPLMDRSFLSIGLNGDTKIRHDSKKGSGTFAGTARRVLRTKVPDPFFEPCLKSLRVTYTYTLRLVIPTFVHLTPCSNDARKFEKTRKDGSTEKNLPNDWGCSTRCVALIIITDRLAPGGRG